MGPGVRLVSHRFVSYRTCRLVFRMRLDRALSCFDSYALERRLGSGLLLRHPQVSNQNSKRADSIRREGETGKIYQYPYPFPAAPQPFSSISRPRSNSYPIHPIHSTRQILRPYRSFFCGMTGTKAETVFFVHQTRLLLSPRATRTRSYLFQISFLFLLHPYGASKTPKGNENIGLDWEFHY